MSLILEALKKSEAERRLGQAPGLLSPAPRIARRHIAPWLLVPVALMALAAVVASAWWLGRSAAPEPAPPAIATPAPAAVDTVPPPAASAAVESAAIELPETAPPPEDTPPQPPPRAHVPPRPEPADTGAPPPVAATPASTAPPTVAPVEAPPKSATDAATAAAPPDTPPPAEALPTLRDLPAGERDALPPLAVTMHVYAEQPERRFALIDGRRRSEGDKLADGLVLEEIRRDGIVLNLHGRRILLPRPG